MKVSRISTVGSPAPYAFEIPEILEVLYQYKKPGERWLDPMAGFNSPAECTNDISALCPTQFHMDAVQFLRGLDEQFDGVIFDPPSARWSVFNERCKDEIAKLVKPGGYVFSHGHTSAGMCRERGFEPVEYVICFHGGVWSDTIISVERKMDATLSPERGDWDARTEDNHLGHISP